jgi:hypothetical protein
VNAGIDVIFIRNGRTWKDADDGELIGVVHCGPDGLCILLANVVYEKISAKAFSKSGNDLWHERLGHCKRLVV